MNKHKLGLLFGIAAYVMWGAFPLYWPLLKPATPLEIVSHRSIWTLVFCVVVLLFKSEIKTTFALLKRRDMALKLFSTSALISINWLIYIWAVNHGHVVEGALGYYINPLIAIGFGVIFLKERMRPLQWASVAFATLGVIVLTVDYGRLPWIAFGLAISWGTYGIMKKQLGLGALEGLAVETFISAPLYGGYLIWLALQGTGQLGQKPGLTILLVSAGAVTAIPLLFFNGAATRLPLTSIGLLQYITPTLQFAIGVWVKHEDMPTARWIGFFAIWSALTVLAFDLVKSNRTVNNSVAER